MNQLKGKVTNITIKDQFSKVAIAVENQVFKALVVNEAAINPNLTIGHTVTILFKETDVTLSVGLPEKISIENQIPVIIKELKKGVLLSSVTVAFQNTLIKAVVPAEFAAEIEVGMSIIMLIRSNELMLTD